jgi:chorismate dehydratase
MTTVRLGAVGYLNARPLVHTLDSRDGFDLRFDVPSTCAALLHAGEIDVGMIPSIEYLRGSVPYEVVPDLGIVSDGPVASVAVFARVDIGRIRRVGLDASSRTSAGLTRVLCREAWNIDPVFEPMPPERAARVDGCDAALVIGDPARVLDYERAGFRKIDLGLEWQRLTGLPFVWAFWAGRAGALDADHVEALQAARDAGIAASDAIADAYCGPERSALCRRYLRENIKYHMRSREIAGVERYFELSVKHHLLSRPGRITMYATAEERA